jgi:drug/metabolite transporter (DMT)-like permease
LSSSLEGQAGRDLLMGDGILMGAVLAWSLVTVLSRPLLAKLPSFALSRLLLLIGAAMLTPFVYGDVAAYAWRDASPRFLAVVAFLGVATSVVAYVLWNVILRRLGSVRCAVLITLQPPCVGLLAWAVLDEPVSVHLFIGGALVVVGVVLAQRAVARAHADALIATAADPPLAA